VWNSRHSGANDDREVGFNLKLSCANTSWREPGFCNYGGPELDGDAFAESKGNWRQKTVGNGGGGGGVGGGGGWFPILSAIVVVIRAPVSPTNMKVWRLFRPADHRQHKVVRRGLGF